MPNNELILLNEGLLDKLPILASLGLASALSVSAAQNKSVQVSRDLKTSPKSTHDDSLFTNISKWEGVKTKVYKDHAGNPTIGIGHYLNNKDTDRAIIKYALGDSVNYDDLLSGKQSLTLPQVEKLFNIDVKVKEATAIRLIPDFKSLNTTTKNAIINALFRGDLGKKTISYINKKDWKNATKEYLNHKNAKTGPVQVKKRMIANANAFASNITS
jgi:hypothetical protein